MLMSQYVIFVSKINLFKTDLYNIINLIMTSTNCFAFLPEEIEMMIYKYEHQMKTASVLDELKKFDNCNKCNTLSFCLNICFDCGDHTCDDCAYGTENGDPLCFICDHYRDMETEDDYNDRLAEEYANQDEAELRHYMENFEH